MQRAAAAGYTCTSAAPLPPTLCLAVWLHRLDISTTGRAVARSPDAAATEAVAAAGEHTIMVQRPAWG